jgi:hypothetical protein
MLDSQACFCSYPNNIVKKTDRLRFRKKVALNADDFSTFVPILLNIYSTYSHEKGIDS